MATDPVLDSRFSDDKPTELDQQLQGLTESVGDTAENIQGNYDQRMAAIEADKESLNTTFAGLFEEISANYASERLDSDALLGGLRDAYTAEVTNMTNAYNNQIARESERVDALVANGALGGNAYRAYQAHTQTNRDLMAQASGQIAQLSIQAAETLTAAGVDIATKNQEFFTTSMASLAAVADAQSRSMLGFSQLLVSTQGQAENSIQNIFALQLASMTEQDDLFLAVEDLSMQKYGIDVGAQIEREQQRFDNAIDPWRGAGTVSYVRPSTVVNNRFR